MAQCGSDDSVLPVSTNKQSTRGLRSNPGQGTSRGGWRGPSDDTNLRTRGSDSRDNRLNFNQESGNKKHITVPSDKVGRIIGKGGCKIRQLEYESESKIKIGDSSGNETTISLFGSPEAILTVEGMINKLLEDRRPNILKKKKDQDWFTDINWAEPSTLWAQLRERINKRMNERERREWRQGNFFFQSDPHNFKNDYS